jgi:hypothetical protein
MLKAFESFFLFSSLSRHVSLSKSHEMQRAFGTITLVLPFFIIVDAEDQPNHACCFFAGLEVGGEGGGSREGGRLKKKTF